MTGKAGTPSFIARAGLWSALAFVLNLTWEIVQARLYTLWASPDHMAVVAALLHCSLGDVLIALTMFAVANIFLRGTDWPMAQPWAGCIVVVTGAMAFTAWSEWYNVYLVGNWGYTASMPLIFGIGLSPLFQWLILPPMMTAAHRMLEPMLFSRRRL